MCDQPDRPEWADLPGHEWICEHCGAKNWWEDGECQFCDIADEPDDQEVA